MERMFNLDPQLIQDVVITAVNIFILFLAGSYLMFNPVRNFLNKRKEGIADDIEKAKTDMQDAQAMKAEYEAKLKEVDKEVEAILADARKRALAREEQIIEEAKTEAAHIIERAHNEVLLEKKGAADDMKKEMIALASALAGKVVSASIDTDIQASLVDETLREMGDDTWQNSQHQRTDRLFMSSPSRAAVLPDILMRYRLFWRYLRRTVSLPTF